MRRCAISSRTGHCTTRPSASRHVAGAVVEAARTFGLPLLGLPGSLLETEARNHGVVYVAEGFPDRRYRGDGSLAAPKRAGGCRCMSRTRSKSKSIRLAREGRVATLCIHGDEPGAVANAALVRQVLKQHGISVRSFVERFGLMGLVVVNPGLCTTVQDAGRPGLCRVGSLRRRGASTEARPSWPTRCSAIRWAALFWR